MKGRKGSNVSFFILCQLQVTICVGAAVARVSVYDNWRQGNEGSISDCVCHLR